MENLKKMLTLLLINFLVSNAVTLIREKSILFSRVVITPLAQLFPLKQVLFVFSKIGPLHPKVVWAINSFKLFT